MSGNEELWWRYEYEPGFCGEIIAGNGTTVAAFADEPSDADARIMAAAPQMLDALEAANRMIEEAIPRLNWAASSLDGNAIMLLNEVSMQVRAAILKAKGEE